MDDTSELRLPSESRQNLSNGKGKKTLTASKFGQILSEAEKLYSVYIYL